MLYLSPLIYHHAQTKNDIKDAGHKAAQAVGLEEKPLGEEWRDAAHKAAQAVGLEEKSFGQCVCYCSDYILVVSLRMCVQHSAFLVRTIDVACMPSRVRLYRYRYPGGLHIISLTGTKIKEDAASIKDDITTTVNKAARAPGHSDSST